MDTSLAETFELLKQVQKESSTAFAQWDATSRTTFPSEELMASLSDRLERICVRCEIPPIVGKVLLDTVMLGLYNANDLGEFVVNLASRLRIYYKDSTIQMKLVRLLLSYNPDCFRGLCSLEDQLEDGDDSEEYIRTVKRVIEVGGKQGRDMTYYRSRLDGHVGPARDVAHATLLAYYKYRKQLREEYPGASVGFCFNNDNTYTINVTFFGASVPKVFPPDSVVHVDDYSVKICFWRSGNTRWSSSSDDE